MVNHRKNHKEVNYGARIAIRVPSETKQRLTEIIQSQKGATETSLVRSLIDEYLKKQAAQ